MPQAASITTNDRAGTPVAHVFTPRRVNNDVAAFAESASVPSGDKKLTLTWKKTAAGYKVGIVLANPVLVTETINGVSRYSVDRTAYVNATFTFAEESTLQERKDTVGMFANALASSVTVVDGVLTGLEGVW